MPRRALLPIALRKDTNLAMVPTMTFGAVPTFSHHENIRAINFSLVSASARTWLFFFLRLRVSFLATKITHNPYVKLFMPRDSGWSGNRGQETPQSPAIQLPRFTNGSLQL